MKSVRARLITPIRSNPSNWWEFAFAALQVTGSCFPCYRAGPVRRGGCYRLALGLADSWSATGDSGWKNPPPPHDRRVTPHWMSSPLNSPFLRGHGGEIPLQVVPTSDDVEVSGFPGQVFQLHDTGALGLPWNLAGQVTVGPNGAARVSLSEYRRDQATSGMFWPSIRM